MAKETERRFLLRSDEWRELAGRGIQYVQGYLSTDAKRNVRIRIGENKAQLAVKGEAKGVTRPEFEYPIPLRDAKDIEKLCLKPVLQKTRYTLKRDGLTWEIDEYAGNNKGLIVAEVETESALPVDKKPSWIGAEISGDDRYRNANLVEHPFTTWTQDRQKPGTKYCLQSSEKLPDGLRRILSEQLNAAIAELSDGRGSRDNAVHEARKCVKRTRSLLRLLRRGIQKTYSRENERLQVAGRKLSELRDAQALIEALQDLESAAKKKSKSRGNHDFAGAYDLLRERKRKITGEFEANGDLETATEQLEQSLKAIAQLSLQKINFRAITESLEITIKRGKKAFSQAYEDPLPERFHEWRKRVKDLRYQISLLAELWPDVFEGYAKSAKKLEEILGDDHNLSVLAGILKRDKDAHGSFRKIQALIEKKQADLREKARQRSSRLYSEPVKAWTRRLESSWKAWAAENGR